MRIIKWQSILILILFLISPGLAKSQASGLVDGEVWTADQSPIHITGDLTVLQLTIEPGVEILFDGNYRMTVSGVLTASGTEQDSIIFRAANSNVTGWGGIYFDNADVNSQLSYCRISQVVSNPALEINNTDLNLQHTVIANNQAAGLKLSGSNVQLERCSVRDNGQQGAVLQSASQLHLTACHISGNQDSGLETSGGQLTLQNSIVALNQKEGILLSNSGDILNCTNSVIAYNNQEGIINLGGSHNVVNSIIYFNNAAQQIVKISGSGQVNYSDVAQTGLGGTGNIMDDPLFADSKTFELQANSPAIDAGDPSASYNDRYFPPSMGTERNDMGAFGGPYARKWFPPVFVQPDTLDFGNVSLGDSLTLHLKLKNYSDAVLTISQISLAGANAVHFKINGNFDNTNLPMADSLLIPVTFHPLQTSSLPYQAQLVISTNLEQKITPLIGTVVTPNIFTLPDLLTFEALAVTEADSQLIKIFNTGTDTLYIDSLRFGTSSFSALLPETMLAPYSESYLPLTVIFSPDTIGPIEDTLRIFSNDPDSPVFTIPLSGSGLAPLMQIASHFLNFDSVQVFTDSSLSIQIENAGNLPLQIQSMAFKNFPTPFNVDVSLPLEIAPGNNSGPIAVHFTPDSTRFFEDTLVIQSNDPFSAAQQLALSGTGIGAFLKLPVSRVDFGQLAMPEDSLLKLTIRNSGNIDLQIQSIMVEGTDAPSFSWWKTTGDLNISPLNDSLQIYLRCKPQRSGALQAALKIESNDALHPSFELPLNAFVKAAELKIEPATVRFDSTIIFDQQSETVKIFNPGDYRLTIDSVLINLDPDSDVKLPTFNLPLTLEPRSDTLSFQISFNPKRVGTQKASIQFYSNDPFQNPRILNIEAHAVEPKLVLASDTLNFGRSSIYRTLERSVMLKNMGNATVKIDSFALSDTTAFSIVGPLPDHLPADGDSVALNIRFKPKGSGLFKSVLQIFWNNPYHQPSALVLMAEADSARLFTQSLINFEKQVVKTSTVNTIKIYNQSHVLIYVDSVQLNGPDAEQFVLEEMNVPLVLNPEDSLLSFNVTYRPQETGLHLAQIDLFSQDIEGHQLTVKLQGIALHSSASPLLICSLPDSSNFGAVFVDESKTWPFYLANLGNAGLTIDSLSISGDQANAFRLSSDIKNQTIALDDTLQNLYVEFHPQTAQDYEAELNIYSNDPEHSPFKVRLTGRGKIDSTPAQLSFNPDSLTLTIGQQFELNIPVTDDSTTIQQVTLYLRPGAKQQFQAFPLEKSTGDNWSATLPESLITERGLEAYFEIEHGGRQTLYPENGAQSPLYLSVFIPQKAFPFATKKEKYQMISLPFFSDLSLKDLFADELGNYNPEKYRIFDWDVEKEQFIEQKDLKRKFIPGYALYLITRDSIVLNASQLKSVPTNKNFQFTVKQGWNMIANPFPFPVSWQDVTNGWPKVPVLYYYNGTGWEIANRLEPFKGYAIKIDQGIQVIGFPPKEAPLSMSKPVANHGWRLQLKAKSGIYHDDFNFVGSRSKNDPLAYDWPEPPSPGTFVSLYFEDEDGQRCTSRFVTNQNNGQQFDFTVDWNTQTAAQLRIIPDSLPQGWSWQLIALSSKLILGNDTPISLSQPGQRFRLIVGPTDYVRQQTTDFLPIPKEFKISQNFPNPFNQNTTIKFQLPATDRLSVTIFDIQGRKVKTLVKNKPYQSGYYSLRWDGKNSDGQNVASGLYFLHFKGEKYSATRKLILQK